MASYEQSHWESVPVALFVAGCPHRFQRLGAPHDSCLGGSELPQPPVSQLCAPHGFLAVSAWFNKKNTALLTRKTAPMKKIIATLLLVPYCLVSSLSAQPAEADFMRSTGKIYVVVAVIVAIFIGLVFFLLYLDRRLTKLEDQIIEHE